MSTLFHSIKKQTYFNKKNALNEEVPKRPDGLKQTPPCLTCFIYTQLIQPKCYYKTTTEKNTLYEPNQTRNLFRGRHTCAESIY